MRRLAAIALLAAACSSQPKPRVTLSAPCESDRDCLYGLVCRGDTAGDADAGASSGRACRYQEFGRCTGREQCLPGQLCRDGSCTVECVQPGDCEAGRVCFVGECRLASEASACRTTADCGVDEECEQGMCVDRLRMRCFRDSDCGPAERCLGGNCR